MIEEEIELTNKCNRLQAENDILNLRLKNFEENVTRIITNFWCWYVSGNHKRDLSAKEEGEKYANNFFHDLIQETDVKESESKSDIFPEITLPERSAEHIDKVIVDIEKHLKEQTE